MKKSPGADSKSIQRKPESPSPRPDRPDFIAESTPRSWYATRDFYVLLTGLGDLLSILCALFLAVWMRFHWPHIGWIVLPAWLSPRDYFHYVIIGAVLLLVILQRCGAYNEHYLLHGREMLARVVKSCAIWFFLFLLITLFLEFRPPISRMFVVWCFLNSLIFLCAWRAVWSRILHTEQVAGRLRDRVLFVGWNRESERLAQAIRHDVSHPYEIIGCVPSAHGRFWVRPDQEIPVLGDYNAIGELIARQRPDIVILADLDPVVGEIIALANLCEKEHVTFKIIPSYFQILVSGLHLETISDVPILGVSRLPLDHTHKRFIKRVVDMIGALVGLAVSAPLILFFGWLIHRESPGPIFYKQTRTGRRGRHFTIYKLRSMKLGAETDQPGWTTADDPRRLRIGAFLRKWNIDEVPQFWNVLVGDMSLVGPRPERPEHIVDFKEEIPHYNARHYVRPGLSGWAQIHGFRGDTDLEERIRYDLYYLENWSLWLDFYIMFATFKPHEGAY